MSEFLGEASVLIRPDTRAFRATLEAELLAVTRRLTVAVPVLTAATKGVGTAGTAVNKGLAASTVATKEFAAATALSTGAVIANAGALDTEGVAAIKEAEANKRSASSARANALAHEQAARGISATLLSLLGIRGATLAASAPFLAGAAAVTVLTKSIRESSKEQEAAVRVAKILGVELGAGSERWAHTLADSFGLSAEAALKFEGAIAEVLHNVHLAPAEIASMSQGLVKLAADVAAFNNVPVTDVLRSLQLGLSGNLRGLRQFGISFTQAEVKAKAFQETGKTVSAELTRQDLLFARVALITQQSANQVGTFAQRSGNLADQSKILRSNLSNLAAEIGGPLAKVITGDIILINKLFDAFGKGKSVIADFVHDVEGIHIPEFGRLGGDINFGAAIKARDLLKTLKDVIDTVSQAGQALPGVLGPVGGDFQALEGPITASAQALRDFQSAANQLSFVAAEAQIAGLQQHMLDLVFTGASSARKIATDAAIIAQAQSVIRTPGRGGAAAQARARALRNQAQADAASIRAADKAARDKAAADALAAANKAAADAKADAAAAQAALDKADQAFLNEIGLGQARLQNRLLIAEGTKTLADDIRANEAIRNFVRRSIADAARTIHDLLLRAQTIVGLRQTLIQVTQTLKQLRAQELQAIKDARKQREASREESIRLDIAFAQSQTGPGGTQTALGRQNEIRAREALIRQLREEQERTKRGTNEWKRLRNDIAAEQAAIRALKKQVLDRGKEFQALSFAFLESQQGFAANLLSNLLPASSVAGTVGGGAISTPTLPQVPRGPGGPGGVGLVPSLAGASQRATERGVTQGQGGAQIDLLRQIVRVLHRIAGDAQHPEARHQKVVSAADMTHPV